MNNSSCDKSSNSQKISTVNQNDKKLPKDTFNAERIAHNSPEHINNVINTQNNEVTYNDNSYDDAGVMHVAEKIGNQTVNGINLTTIKSYDHSLISDAPQNKILYPPNNNYNQFNESTLERKLISSNDYSYNIDLNTNWNINDPLNLENYSYLNTKSHPNHPTSIHNLPYNLGKKAQFNFPENSIPPMYSRNANIQKNPPFSNPYHLNPYSEVNPFYRRENSNMFLHTNEFNSLCNPRFSGYENVSPYIYYNNFKNMPPHLYYLVKDKDRCSFLKKGINHAMNACNSNTNESYVPKYEYIIQGPQLSYLNYPNQKKFDVFKKLTLTVGTYLDDAVNIMIDVLESSVRTIKKNNSTNLYDLYPFYDPDPVYSRQERPTLKTGSNLFDKINCALDGSTLERHKNTPKDCGRIIIPKTEKTGHVIVDGINNILDNLLNEPLSYQKYDYFSDKIKPMNEIKQQ